MNKIFVLLKSVKLIVRRSSPII